MNDTNNQGFTLVELLITIAISGIILAAIYGAYITQQKSYIIQDQVAEMQQNLRAASDFISRDIRMAGLDPTGGANAGITTATRGQLNFSKDTNGDGDTADADEIIDYGYSLANDADRNGIPDILTNGVPDAQSLGRRTGNGVVYQPIADNIQAIEFYYTLEDGTQTFAPAQLDDIRTIQVSILARASRPDTQFLNNITYCPASKINSLTGQCTNPGPTWGPYNDNYRRRLLITTIECRNLGI